MNILLRSLLLRFLSAGLVLLLFSSNIFAGNMNLIWNASSSANVGGYMLSYGQSIGNYDTSIDVGNTTSYTVPGLQEGTKYYFSVKAYDVNRTTESDYSNEVNWTVPVTEALTVDFTASKTSGSPGMLVNFTPITTGEITSWEWGLPGSSATTSQAQFASVSYPTPGTYTVNLTVTGPSGSFTQTKSNLITVTDTGTDTDTDTGTDTGTDTDTGASNVGLVAAYGFDEDNGTTVVDASGKGNHGVIQGPTRITNGRYGKALKFDGLDDYVTVHDSASLDLSTGLTLEAWVYPTSLSSGGKTVIFKEDAGYGKAVYNLYTQGDADLPTSSFNDGNDRIISGANPLPMNQWTHLVATYNGRYHKLYVNGIKVTRIKQNGLIEPSYDALRIGGNTIFGEYFKGYIDEVRIYDRALTATEVNNNLATAVSVSDPLSDPDSQPFLLGNTTLEPDVDSEWIGRARAFQTVAGKSGAVTTVEVYLDFSTTATELVAGIYEDKDGQPGNLIAQGRLNTLKFDAWNSVTIPQVSVTAGQSYWFAILGPDGEISFLKQNGSGIGVMVSSKSYRLTSLPDQWTSAWWKRPIDAVMSVYGKGH